MWHWILQEIPHLKCERMPYSFWMELKMLMTRTVFTLKTCVEECNIIGVQALILLKANLKTCKLQKPVYSFSWPKKMSHQQNIINLFPSLAHWFSCVEFACGLECHEARGSNGFFNGKAQELVTFWLVCLKLKTNSTVYKVSKTLAKKTQVHSHMTSNTHTHTHTHTHTNP